MSHRGRRLAAAGLPVVALAAVGWVDLATGPLFAFFPFYLLVLVFSALVNSWRVSLPHAVVAAAIFLGVDLATVPTMASTPYPYWRAVAQLMSFGLVTYVIPGLIEERRRLERSEALLVRRQAEIEVLNGKLLAALEEVSRTKSLAIEDLRRQHANEMRRLREALGATQDPD